MTNQSVRATFTFTAIKKIELVNNEENKSKARSKATKSTSFRPQGEISFGKQPVIKGSHTHCEIVTGRSLHLFGRFLATNAPPSANTPVDKCAKVALQRRIRVEALHTDEKFSIKRHSSSISKFPLFSLHISPFFPSIIAPNYAFL